MLEARGAMGERGEGVEGPPWILGHRGTPKDAPENTLTALRRAIDLGLDGVEYDLHACATGEPVLIHDETLDRTTDAAGAVAARTLPELAGVDAGGWFDKRFAGEPLPLLEEALDLPGAAPDRPPMHMIELKDPALVAEVVRQLRQTERPRAAFVASFDREVCREARDAGVPSMLIAYDADEDDRRFVRDERIQAYATGPGGWRTAAGRAEWSAERWSWSVDSPADLLEACRAPLAGLNTNEPLRALSIRALVRLTPHDDGPYPLEVPALEVPAGPVPGAPHGEWAGRWDASVGVRNPFPFPVEVAVTVAPRGGAFEIAGPPFRTELAPAAVARLPVTVAGGSWSPGEDPLVLARFVWRAGPGRPRESLILDAPLERRRTLRIGRDTERVALLRESPTAREASMTVRRRGGDLLAWVEDPGGLSDVRAMVLLGSRRSEGARGVRARLPESRDADGGLPFSLGFEGRRPEDGERVLVRWAGGLPGGARSGAPGRLLLL